MEQELKNDIELAKAGILPNIEDRIYEHEHNIAVLCAPLLAGGQKNLHQILITYLDTLKGYRRSNISLDILPKVDDKLIDG